MSFNSDFRQRKLFIILIIFPLLGNFITILVQRIYKESIHNSHIEHIAEWLRR